MITITATIENNGGKFLCELEREPSNKKELYYTISSNGDSENEALERAIRALKTMINRDTQKHLENSR